MKQLDTIEGNIVTSLSAMLDKKDLILHLKVSRHDIENTVFDIFLNENEVDKLQTKLHEYYNLKAVIRVEEQEGL